MKKIQLIIIMRIAPPVWRRRSYLTVMVNNSGCERASLRGPEGLSPEKNFKQPEMQWNMENDDSRNNNNNVIYSGMPKGIPLT